MSATLLDILTNRADGTVDSYAWPGGYPIFYLTGDGETLCPDCVNANIKEVVEATLTGIACSDKEWQVEAADVNYEDETMQCVHCSKRIESAYGE